MTFKGSLRPISSPAPEPGPMQLDLLVGLTTGPCGPAPAPASRSRKLASEPVLLMNGICGQTFIDSSALAVRPSSLASRLAARLGMLGSTESPLIWSAKATPAKRLIFRLRPWTRRTSGSGFTGSQSETVWPTPTVADVQGGRKHRSGKRANEPLLNGIMHQSTWSTPRATDGEKGGGSYSDPAKAEARIVSGHQVNLQDQMVAASHWATPLSSDVMKQSENPATTLRRMAKGQMIGLNAHLALEASRQMAASWPTPCSLSFDASHQPGNNRSINKTLDLARGTTALSGPAPNGSNVTMEKRGAPNPDFAFWLMGYPEEFINGVSRATASVSRSRSNSSKR